MAKQWMTLLLAAGAMVFSMAASAEPGDDGGATLATDLLYHEDGGSVRAVSHIVKDRTFDIEPDFEGRKVLRGVLSLWQEIPFIWDYTEGALYIDKNGNRDLTDDPDGVYQSGNDFFGMSDYHYHTFDDIRFAFERDGTTYPYRLSASMYRYRDIESCSFTILSVYRGQADLYGRSWSFAVADNGDGLFDRGDRLSIACADSVPEAGDDTNRVVFSLPKRLFLDGRLYQCGYAFAPDGEQAILRLTLTEEHAATGEVLLPGEHLDTLQLIDRGRELAILLTEPRGSAILPVGSYAIHAVTLAGPDGSRASLRRSFLRKEDDVSIREDQTAELRVGGPLNHTVTIEKQGKVLFFMYGLEGIGGEQYDVQTLSIAGRRPDSPLIEIYKGDTLLETGTFEYG